MTTVLCTLYNSLYLDKGLVLYDSLCECAKDFKLYVLCMDDKCYEVLTDLKQEHHIPVRLSDFEEGDDELLAAKANRTKGEYCWTCTSSFIRYILKHYKEDICTYIDADMFFYSDPQVLIEEMMNKGCSAMVVPHRFPEGKEYLVSKVGHYCVEFNTFVNNKKGVEVLEYWRSRCLESVARLGDGVHWGDQKYLDELVVKFDCVHVCENKGAGVAPWNLTVYKSSNEANQLLFIPKYVVVDLVFFHYQGIAYVTRKLVSTGILLRVPIDKRCLESLYIPYLRRIDIWKNELSSKYGYFEMIQGHPSERQRHFKIKNTVVGHFIWFLYNKLFGITHLVAF